jgi:hypothetical protein
MTLVDRGIAAEAINIPVAVDVPDVNAGAAIEDDGEGMVIVGAIFLFEFEIVQCLLRRNGQCVHINGI